MFPGSQLFIYLTQPVTQLSTMFPGSQLFIYLIQPVTQHLTMFPESRPFIYLTQPVIQHLTMFPESQPFIYLTQPVTMFPWWQLSVCQMILPLPQIPQRRLFPQRDYSSPTFAFWLRYWHPRERFSGRFLARSVWLPKRGERWDEGRRVHESFTAQTYLSENRLRTGSTLFDRTHVRGRVLRRMHT